MPAYGMPGVSTSRRGARVLGVVVVVLALVAGIGWRIGSATHPAQDLRIQLRTNRIGDGVVDGAEVRLNGIKVGSVTDITAEPGGQQLIVVSLNPSQLFGLTDSFDVDYAPSNLFGISEITLKRRGGGTALRNNALVDLTAVGRVNDVTMGNLLRSLAVNANDVLTPELTEMLNRASADLVAFTPMIQAVVNVSRAVADTQRYPPSFLIEQYASFFNGVSKFADGTVRLVYDIYNINVLRNDRARFDVGVGLVVDDLFPSISKLGWTAKDQLGGYADAFTPVLNQMAQMVPNPAQSSADITELLNRLNLAFQDTSAGPELGVAVTLRGMPGLAVPLFGGHALPSTPTTDPAGGPR
ncbi:MlaD family protein [Nocardia sp. NPDC051756]|uniref:MlaD family protein n=1 Tax=Nocardia sp. NPDC051756 TaxID=3154751 RepID=UPI003417F2E2